MDSDPPSYASDTESEGDWEEVAVHHEPGVVARDIDVATLAAAYGDLSAPTDSTTAASGAATPGGAGPSSASAAPPLEITIQARKDAATETKKRGISHAERVMRINCHKFHTVALLANALIRNKWINDDLLHARLMSLTPLSLQTSFTMIHKSRVPDANKRGRLFEAAMGRLVEWWSETFFEVLPEGHIRSYTYDDVAAELAVKEAKAKARAAAKAKAAAARAKDKKGKGKMRARALSSSESDSEEEDEGEVIRGPKSLMKHALMRCGSRDVSAQLFTALCRALNIPARLVVSLQSMPWQTGVGKPKPTYNRSKTKKKEEAKIDVPAKDEGAQFLIGVSDPKGKGKAPAVHGFPGEGRRMDGGSSAPVPLPPPAIKLRKSKSGGRTLGSSSASPAPVLAAVPTKLAPADPTTTAPVFWTEVYSRPDARWIPVDPIRALVNKRRAFDPGPPVPGVRVENRMVYVLAVEEDGFARDVTARYARDYGARVAKLQGAPARGRRAWWERVCAAVQRPYRLQRDDVEDAELQAAQLTEAMPGTLAGFKDHPLYALARHVRRDEVVHPLVELGKFRGEPVYPRASVLSLKAPENWMRAGRVVKAGQQPMKYVPQRAVTVGRQRALEMAKEERAARGGEAGVEGGDEGIMQGLYAFGQTELYVPPPVVDGKVPKNDFGNIDLYVPSMLPTGAVHIPYKGIAKIARQLGIDFAEAVVGFEFKKRKATPVVKGVVIAAENEEALLDAYRAAEEERVEREHNKKRERVLKRWARLVQGLRIRQRLQAQYAGPAPQGATVSIDVVREANELVNGGGFLAEPDSVVTSYTLPKTQHVRMEDVIASGELSLHRPEDKDEIDHNTACDHGVDGSEPNGLRDFTLIIEEDVNSEMEDIVDPPIPLVNGDGPLTMREMAEAEAAAVAHKRAGTGDDDEAMIIEAPEPAPQNSSEIRKSTRGSTKAKSTTVPDPTKGAKPKSKGQARRTRSSAGRKRARGESEEDEEDEELAEESEDVVPVRKRAKKVPPAPVPAASGRVLRSRKGKSAADVKAEEEREQAYRRAVGEMSGSGEE